MTRTLTPILPPEMDFFEYESRFERGLTPDRYPYGLENLPEDVELVVPTAARLHSKSVRIIRRAALKVLGLDLVGAVQRAHAIRKADVIYSHTEQEYLGVALLLRLTRARRPILLGQTIWLFHGWDRQPAWRRALFKWCSTRVDLFIYNARPNFELGRTIFQRGTHKYIPFGISRTFSAAQWTGPGGADRPLILAVGNDHARDWKTFAEALDLLPAKTDVRIATGEKISVPSAVISPTKTLAELIDLYQQATCVVAPVIDNAHASGITTILEAAAVGAPIVASRTGGIDDYFDAREIKFVPVGDAPALAARLLEAIRTPSTNVPARDRVQSSGYLNYRYWQRVTSAAVSIKR